MQRRAFLKYLATSGLLATTGGVVSTILSGCSDDKGFDIEERYPFFDYFDNARISSTMSQYVRKTPITVNGDTREVLFAPPQTEITFTNVPVYRYARLSFGMAIHDEAWGKKCNGVLFEIVLTDARGQDHLVYSRYVDPRNNVDDRSWIDQQIGLHDYREQRVGIRFATSSDPEAITGYEWSGWSGLELVSQRRKRTGHAGKKDNVILITIDTLRHDYVGCYGNRMIKTPALDRIAREGVICRNAFSHSHITLPSHVTILTSLYPKDHQVRSNSKQDLHPKVTTISEYFKSHGYQTAAIVSMQPLTEKWIRGIERGFDDLLGPEEIERIAGETNKDVFGWLKENYDKKFFLWIHYFDPHMPYTPPAPYNGLYYEGDPKKKTPDSMKEVRFPRGFYHKPHDRLIKWLDGIQDVAYPPSQYAGEISYVDNCLGDLVTFLEETGLDNKTLLAVTADHGESLGEHHIYFDHKGLYDQTMHVPLLFRYPGRLKPRELDGLVGSVDIMPTVLNIAGIEIPETIRGRSLLRFLKDGGDEINGRIYGEHVNDSQVMVRTQAWKCIKTYRTIAYHEKFGITEGNIELYNMQDDPDELVNVAPNHDELVEQFGQDLDTWLSDALYSTRMPANLMDKESKEMLRALGYTD